MFYILLGLLIAESVVTALLPQARGFLFGQLEVKGSLIYIALGVYWLNYFIFDLIQSFKGYAITLYATTKRAEYSTKLIKHPYFKRISNYAQRVQEDVKLMYVCRYTVYAEYFISATIVLQLIFINLHQPLLVISSLVYAVVSILIAVRFNPRLTSAEKVVQQEEASFREAAHSLSREALRGLEKANLSVKYSAWIRTQYLLFTKLQLGFIIVLPYLILLPAYLSANLSLGDMIKHQSTFSLLVVNAAILINYYPTWIMSRASHERVKELL
jgi:ABC-type uncharacterized transport system fused permease/ATPase subunit